MKNVLNNKKKIVNNSEIMQNLQKCLIKLLNKCIIIMNKYVGKMCLFRERCAVGTGREVINIMKKSTLLRYSAVAMSVLLAAGAVPTGFVGGNMIVNAEETSASLEGSDVILETTEETVDLEETSTGDNEELTENVQNEYNGSYVLDSSKLPLELFGETGATIAQDTVIGTDDFYTLMSKGGKMKMVTLETPLACANGTYSQALQLTGKMNGTTGQAGIKINTTNVSEITVYASAKSSSASILEYADANGTLTTLEELEYGTITKQTIKGLDAGSYYIGGTNGANIYYVEIKYTENYELDTRDVALDAFGEAGTKLSVDTAIGTSDFYTVMGVGSKNLIKDLSASPLSYGDITFDKAIQLGGKLNATTGQSGIKITTTETSNITIYASAKSSSASILEYSDMSGELHQIEALENGTILKYTISNLEAGSYYIGGTNGANVFYINTEYVEMYDADANELPLELFGEVGAKISQDTVIGKNDFFTLIATGGKMVMKDLSATPLSYNGTEYTKALQLTGGAKASGQATFKINTKESAKVTIYASAKSAAASNIIYKSVEDTEFTTVDALEDGTINKYVINDLKPGEYNIGGSNGANIFYVSVEYDPADEAQVAWDKVSAPTINSVVTDEVGDFVVNFDAVIDSVKGAENVKVSMLENGYEIETVTLKAQADTVTFTPLWSGNYTFVVTALREGEAYKTSEVYDYGYYTLALPKPVITNIANRGDGKVYVDYINVKDADSFSVGYKLTTDSEYTMVANNITDGHYLIEGLTPGMEYEVVVYAYRNSDNFVSTYKKNIVVSENEEKQWYSAIVGSAQTANISTSNGNTYKLDVKESTANKVNLLESEDITNTDATLNFAGQENGKISDDEEGFMYYFTQIDPNTENFEMTATFKITDTSLTPDNQTGFGIVAADMLGINYYGNGDYYHKYFNTVSNLLYSSKSQFLGLRSVTGYESVDTSNNDDVTRTTNATRYTNTAGTFNVGDTYTLTLKKTDEAFVAECNGEVLTLDDTSVLSVQDDGSITVGIMVARKVSVEVSDVKFATSKSAGVTKKDNVDTVATAKISTYSSSTCGAKTYEYVCVPTVDGVLKVTAPNGEVVYNEVVTADNVVRVDVPITIGTNKVTAVLTPDKSQSLTSYADVKSEVEVKCVRYGNEDETIIVSADGTKDGEGTYESPLDINTAVSYAQPGQTILLKDGTYTSWVTINRSVSGTADKHITIRPENMGGVVLEGVGLTVIGSYWDIYGLEVSNSTGVGIQISGNYNTVEMCTVHGSGNSGIQISRSGSASNNAGVNGMLWPSYNLVKNCESYDSCDAGRNDADGFAAKLTCGNGNKFYGCIAHNNIDDGWDLYAKSVTGEIGSVTVENCVAYNNGWLTTDDVTAEGYVYGEGNGFKLGGGYLKGGHKLINSVSFNNGAKGITSNSCPDCEIINCTSYNNSVKAGQESYNVGLNTKTTNVKAWVVDGLISVAKESDTTLEDLIPFTLNSANNYIYNGHASYNNQGAQVTDEWFVNTDVTIVPTRNEDGTINMQGLLVLNENAPSDSGARLDVTSEDAISTMPEITTIVSGKVDAEESTEETTEETTEDTTESTEDTTEESTENTTEDTTEAPSEDNNNNPIAGIIDKVVEVVNKVVETIINIFKWFGRH